MQTQWQLQATMAASEMKGFQEAEGIQLNSQEQGLCSQGDLSSNPASATTSYVTLVLYEPWFPHLWVAPSARASSSVSHSGQGICPSPWMPRPPQTHYSTSSESRQLFADFTAQMSYLRASLELQFLDQFPRDCDSISLSGTQKSAFLQVPDMILKQVVYALHVENLRITGQWERLASMRSLQFRRETVKWGALRPTWGLRKWLAEELNFEL